MVKLRKYPIGLGIPGTQLRQIPLVDYQNDVLPIWQIWISYDNTQTTITAGTFLELHPNGSIWKLTTDRTGEIVSSVKLV